MNSIFKLLLVTLSVGVLAMQQAGGAAAAGASAKVIDVVTFILKSGVTPTEFRAVDTSIERQHVSRQPGFMSRESAAGENGEWLVIVHWRSSQDADASMASFEKAPAAANFMSKIDASTMSMKRYEK